MVYKELTPQSVVLQYYYGIDLLVTNGLYSKIRNPIYVFGMVMIAGMIFLGRPEGWLVLAAAIVGQTVRARRETRVLEVAFGMHTGNTAERPGSN